MCGIVGFIGKENNLPIGALIMSAYWNRHRGEDGVGIIHKDSATNELVVEKYLNNLTEMESMELKETLFHKITKIGSIIFKTPDLEKYNEMKEKWKEEIQRLSETTSDLIFLHHRKATYGANTLENLHPIEVNGKLYIHNGTINPYSLRRWLELEYNIIFNTETDTEVLAVLYNLLKDKGLGKEEIYDSLTDMYPFGFGVLIEFDGDKITLIKDNSRDLWMYEDESGDRIFISEPTPLVKKYNKLIKIEDGIFNLRGEITGKDYTKFSRKVLGWWTVAIARDEVNYLKCDVCNTKKNVLRIDDCRDFPEDILDNNKLTKYKDLCYECMIHLDPENPEMSRFTEDDDIFEELLV